MDNVISKRNNKSYETLFWRILIALVGVALVGFGLAFNLSGGLGNDAVAVLYDGARNILGLQPDKLGVVTNLVNFIFITIVFFLGRKYINIGTFIYALPMGNFVNLGFKLYEILNIPSTVGGSILTSFVGCTMLFLGIGIFIAVDIGMDPCTGITMLVRDKMKGQYKTSKIICDIISLGLGFTLGGKVGVVTVIAALTAGPTVQKISEVFDSVVLRKMNLSKQAIDN